jgi:hypothetical protein
MSTPEVIAMLMPEDAGVTLRDDSESGARATVLLRDPEGRVAIETVQQDSPLGRFARLTGCFRRSRPIIDPISRQIMGYELEIVPSPVLSMR